MAGDSKSNARRALFLGLTHIRLGGTVEALFCCDEANSTRSIHALLDTTSDYDEPDGEEEEHKRLHDLLVEATQPRRQYWAIAQVCVGKTNGRLERTDIGS